MISKANSTAHKMIVRISPPVDKNKLNTPGIVNGSTI